MRCCFTTVGAGSSVPVNMKLTERQHQVLEFIVATQERDGVAPSSREIQHHFGFASQTAAMNHLRALQRKGAVRRQPGKARAVAPMGRASRPQIVEIPIYGQIAAGLAELSEQETLGTASIDLHSLGLSPAARVFALKVRGDSMIDAHITEGDLAILEARPVRHRDIVAALIDGETTLKRYLETSAGPVLQAENPRYPDLHPVAELVVQGVLVALIRQVTTRPQA